MLLFLYCIMCGVTFVITFLGATMLSEFVDSYVLGDILPSLLSALFWPMGLPIGIGMIAVALIIKKYDGGK